MMSLRSLIRLQSLITILSFHLQWFTWKRVVIP